MHIAVFDKLYYTKVIQRLWRRTLQMLRKRLKCLIDRFDISVRQLYAMYVCIFFLPLLLTLLLTNNAISQLESQVQKLDAR